MTPGDLTWFSNLPMPTVEEQQDRFHYDKILLQAHSVFHSIPKTQLHPRSLSLKSLLNSQIFLSLLELFLTIEQENEEKG